MSDRTRTGQTGENDAEGPQTTRAEPQVVRLDDWVRLRRRRPVEPDDPDGCDPGPSAA
jgi:hypothetical protein